MLQKNLDKIIVGAALAAAVSALLPIAKSTFRPLLASSETGSGIMNRARAMVRIAREEMEDIVAEAQFERMKKRLDQEISSLETEPDLK